ncbi:MAG: acetyl-CoA acetyltransferase [Proteobacteria bacterium]|nr:MAG: acetyl-CoA acetyltransferase [Pseudomonadota bacterium]
MGREVAIVGIGSTPFGRSPWSLLKLMAEASHEALTDAGVERDRVEALYVANMGAVRNNRIGGLASALADRLGLLPAAADTVENGPASGGSAVKAGVLAVASGYHDVVLVCGGERMREVSGLEATEFVSTLSHRYAEYPYGVTLPSLAGLFARLFLAEREISPEQLANVALKNHENGARNPRAHLRRPLTLEGILTGPEALLNNPWVAEPLRLYDCCPVSDGAAALLLLPAERVSQIAPNAKAVRVAGLGQATAPHAVHARPDPLRLTSVARAAAQAFAYAGRQPDETDVAELHDAFTVLEIAESEEVGFFPAGEGHLALQRGETARDGALPINPSGGLKARGHPVGATGVSQVVELARQLRHEAGPYQIAKRDPELGFAVNLGGFANNAVATVLARSL